MCERNCGDTVGEKGSGGSALLGTRSGDRHVAADLQPSTTADALNSRKNTGTICNRPAGSDSPDATKGRSDVPTLVIKGGAGNPDGVRVWGSDSRTARGYATTGCTLLTVTGLLGWLLGCATLTRPLIATSLLFAVIGAFNLKWQNLLATDQSGLAVSTWRGERWMDWSAVTEVIRVRRALQPRLMIRGRGATISLDLTAFPLADRDAMTEEVVRRAGLDCTPSWLGPMKLVYRRRKALASG